MTDHPVRGWAFLVARGRRRGYQSLLMPDFLVQSNEYGVLGQTASGDFPSEGAPKISRLNGLAAGDVTLAYVTRRLTPADLEGSPAAGPVTDEFGRPLDLLYGFVCRGADILNLDEADLAAVRAEALQTYQHFLADESGFALASAHPFVLRSTTAPMQQPVPEPTPLVNAPASYLLETPAEQATPAHQPPVPRRPTRTPVLAGAGIIVISLIAWLAIIRGGDAKITKVTFIEPSTSAVFCTAPVTLRATVSSDEPTTITYRWKSDRATSKPVAQSIPQGDTILETTVDLTNESGQIALTQSLIIDEPTKTTTTHTYHLTCR